MGLLEVSPSLHQPVDLFPSGGAVAGALVGTGVGWAAGVGVAEATTAAVTAGAVAEGVNAACGGDMCASETQDAPQAVQEALLLAESAVS